MGPFPVNINQYISRTFHWSLNTSFLSYKNENTSFNHNSRPDKTIIFASLCWIVIVCFWLSKFFMHVKYVNTAIAKNDMNERKNFFIHPFYPFSIQLIKLCYIFNQIFQLVVTSYFLHIITSLTIAVSSRNFIITDHNHLYLRAIVVIHKTIVWSNTKLTAAVDFEESSRNK